MGNCPMCAERSPNQQNQQKGNKYLQYYNKKFNITEIENNYNDDQNANTQIEKKSSYQNKSQDQLKTSQANNEEYQTDKSKQPQSLLEEFQNIISNLLHPQIYFVNLKICELPQNDSYLIKKLKLSFDENRFQRAALNYSHIIKCFLQEYYLVVQNKLNWYEGQNNSFKFCQFMFENESIIYSRYFDQESQSYLNVYSFLNQNDFQNSVATGQVAKSSSNLIAELFCNVIQFDEQNELIFEESFDFNFDQFKSIINEKLEEHNLNCILLQLIDACLLFDELEVFYNQFDQYHVGFIYQNQKLFVKLRKIFTLKKDYKQYILRSKFINEYTNVYDKQHILYYEICSVLELVQTLIQDEKSQLQVLISEFISNKAFKINGVCQKQVYEFFKMHLGDLVLKHFPAINMYILELYMKDLKFMYSQNFMYIDTNQSSIIMDIYYIKEYEENKKNYLFCNMNMFIIWILGANEDNLTQIEEYLTNFSQKYNQKCMQVLSYVLKFFMITDYKPSIIVQILKLMFNYALKNYQMNILGYLIDHLSYFYLKRNQFSQVIEILDIIASNIKQYPSRYQKDVKKQVILLRFLVYLFQKKDFDTIQKQHQKYKIFLESEKEEEIQQKNIIDTCNYLIPTYYLLSSQVIIEDKIEEAIDQQNQQQREKFQQAVENVSKLLYIDIAPLLLDDLGFTKEFLVQPFSSKFQLELKFENINQALVRNSSKIYIENDINQNDFQDLLERIQIILEHKMQLIKCDKYRQFYFNMLSIEFEKAKQFNEMLDFVLSINQCRYADRYFNKIIHIDFKNLIIFTTESELDLVKLKNIYAKQLIVFPEQKYNDIRQITNNLALSVSELQNNSKIIGLKCYENEFQVSEQFYLKLSILQICQQIVEMIFGGYYIPEQVKIQDYRNLDLLKNNYSIELVEFFNKSRNITGDFTIQQFYEDFQTIFPDWNSTEIKQLISLTQFEQSILNEKMQFDVYQIDVNGICQTNLDTYMSKCQIEDVLKRFKNIEFTNQQYELSEPFKQKLLLQVQNEYLIAILRILYLNNIQIDENLLSNLYFRSYDPSELELNTQAKPESIKLNIKYWQYLNDEILLFKKIDQQQQIVQNLEFQIYNNFFYKMVLRLSVPSLNFMQSNLDNLTIYKLDQNLQLFQQEATELPYKNFSYSLFKQQLVCMNMVLNRQEVEQNLKNVENLYKQKIFFEVKDSNLVKESQTYLKQYAKNIAELLINRNQKLIEYFSSVDLNTKSKKCQYFDQEEQYFAEFQKYQSKSTFALLFQGKQEQSISIQNEQGNIYQNLKIISTGQPNSQINSKQIKENQNNKNTQLQTQNQNQEITLQFNNLLKQKETEITKFQKQEEQETQEYKLMFQNNQKVNENEKMNQLTIQAFKDQDLKSNNFDQSNVLDQQLNENIQSLYQQDNLQINNNTTIDFQICRKLNIDEEEEEKEQFQNQTKASNQNNLSNSQIQNKDSNLLLIQSLKFKQSNDLVNIGNFANGGQASVELYCDFKQNKRFALKNFKNQTEYLLEKKNHIKYFLEDKNTELSSFVCQLKAFDDQKCQLLLEIGLCSLSDAQKTLKQNNLQINIQFFVNILIKMISFNIQMNRFGLYHGDIKPQNMVLYLDQNELSAQHQFGFQQADPEYIQLKFIDFASCSDNPDYYYQYQTTKYKYYGYQNQNLDFKQILFAETYSACKSVYYLLDEELQQRMQIISFNYQFQEVSEENNLLFFLQIFLGDNGLNHKLSKVGISVDELIYLAEKHLGKVNEFNEGFKCDFTNALQVVLWQNISDIQNKQDIPVEKLNFIRAFVVMNKLQQLYNKNNMALMALTKKYYKILARVLFQILNVIVTKNSLTEEQLNLILKIILQKPSAQSKYYYLYFIQCACFLYCHSEKDYYQKCIEAIIENQNNIINQNKNNSQILEIVLDVFLSIISKQKVDLLELIERIYLLKIEIQNKHSLLYEFLITYIVETQNEFDEQTLFKMLNILELLNSSQNLNIFQRKLFQHIYLYFLHLKVKDGHQEYLAEFFFYKKICRFLNLMLEQDTIILYNYHVQKLLLKGQSIYQIIDLLKFSTPTSDRKLDKLLKSKAQKYSLNQYLQDINEFIYNQEGDIEEIIYKKYYRTKIFDYWFIKEFLEKIKF
ncbi:hypothetical protein ABPG73_020689 [Tetrahymena malaccensis]